MSTVKKRPQLNSDELHRLKWVLGGVLSLIAISALLYLDISAWLILVAGFVLVPVAMVRPALNAHVPAVVHRLIFPALLAYGIWDVYSAGQPVPTLMRVVVLLLLYRAVTARKRRDDLQLVLLGLFVIIVAGVLTVSLAFAVQITAFAGCALIFMLLVTVIDSSVARAGGSDVTTQGNVPAWTQIRMRQLAARVRETADWRLFLLAGSLFLSLVAVSAVLFMAIPRFELQTGFFMDRLLTRKATTGFSDTLKFGDVISIQTDDSVALRVEVSDRAAVPEIPYWRMIVLDEYRDGTFQMSNLLKRAAYLPERTASRIEYSMMRRSGDVRWTFYLEPGVSRYLPLTGGFRRLLFTEPQIFRVSPALRLVALSRDPLSMKAYRVEGMSVDGRFRDDRFDQQVLDRLAAPGGGGPPMLQLSLVEADVALLHSLVREITGGEDLDAAEFARRASLWLARKHPYSLETAIPPGEGDRLVRWLNSDRGGHCELFAGAFTLLARAAGHPTRVVTGFMGGTWNGDYLMVRNSEAHAWCEIRDSNGYWLRADPTNDGPRLLAEESGVQASTAGVVRAGRSGWSAAMDRLRILWYRRIVNFERSDQLALLRLVQERTASFRDNVNGLARNVASLVRGWLAQPWDLRRTGALVGAVVVFFALVWVLWRRGPGWWRSVRSRRVGVLDPVRREAGYWLRRIEPYAGSEITASVEAELLRIRYGRRDGRVDPGRVFGEARRALRVARRCRPAGFKG